MGVLPQPASNRDEVRHGADTYGTYDTYSTYGGSPFGRRFTYEDFNGPSYGGGNVFDAISSYYTHTFGFAGDGVDYDGRTYGGVHFLDAINSYYAYAFGQSSADGDDYDELYDPSSDDPTPTINDGDAVGIQRAKAADHLPGEDTYYDGYENHPEYKDTYYDGYENHPERG